MSSWGTPRYRGGGGLLIVAVVALVAWALFWAMATQPPADDSGTDRNPAPNACAEMNARPEGCD